jgi:hypothetical protein
MCWAELAAREVIGMLLEDGEPWIPNSLVSKQCQLG